MIAKSCRSLPGIRRKIPFGSGTNFADHVGSLSHTHSPATRRYLGCRGGAGARSDDLEFDPSKRMLHQASEAGQPGERLSLPSPKEGWEVDKERYKGFGRNRRALALSRCRERCSPVWRFHRRMVQRGSRGQAGLSWLVDALSPPLASPTRPSRTRDPGGRPFPQGRENARYRAPPGGIGGCLGTGRTPLRQTGLQGTVGLNRPAVFLARPAETCGILDLSRFGLPDLHSQGTCQPGIR